MIAGKNVSPLADTSVRSDAHRCVVVDPDLFADPDMIACLQKPWGLDIDTRFDHHAAAKLGPEHAQEHDLCPRRQQPKNAASKEKCIDQIPQGPHRQAPVPRNDRARKTRKIERDNALLLHDVHFPRNDWDGRPHSLSRPDHS